MGFWFILTLRWSTPRYSRRSLIQSSDSANNFPSEIERRDFGYRITSGSLEWERERDNLETTSFPTTMGPTRPAYPCTAYWRMLFVVNDAAERSLAKIPPLNFCCLILIKSPEMVISP